MFWDTHADKRNIHIRYIDNYIIYINCVITINCSNGKPAPYDICTSSPFCPMGQSL